MADSDNDYGNEGKAEEGGLLNYKGIYFGDDPNTKYTDPETGAHFEFKDMCKRLTQVVKWRREYEQKIAAYQIAMQGGQTRKTAS